MGTLMRTVQGVRMTVAAAENVAETATDVKADVARLRTGLTVDALAIECLDGADPDRVEGWRDYVEAVCAAASLPEATAEKPSGFSVAHYPHHEVGTRWAVLNLNRETVAYAYCEALATTLVGLMNQNRETFAAFDGTDES